MQDDELKSVPINSKGFGTISKLVMQDQSLDIRAKAIYAYLNSFAGSGDTCFPSRDKICRDLCISKNTLSKYMKQLIEAGYISVSQAKNNGKFSHNVYTICGECSPCTNLPCTKLPYTVERDTTIPYTVERDTNINNTKINNNKNKQSNNKQGTDSLTAIVNGYTDNDELRLTISEFIKMRKLMKKPMTEFALRRMLANLDKLAQTDSEKVAILSQSIERSWLGVFPLKSGNQKKQTLSQPEKPETEAERIQREQMEAYIEQCERRWK